jgi:hypothetical protein
VTFRSLATTSSGLWCFLDIPKPCTDPPVSHYQRIAFTGSGQCRGARARGA